MSWSILMIIALLTTSTTISYVYCDVSPPENFRVPVSDIKSTSFMPLWDMTGFVTYRISVVHAGAPQLTCPPNTADIMSGYGSISSTLDGSPLEPLTVYDLRLFVINSTFQQDYSYSSLYNVTTATPPITGVKASDIRSNQIDVSWDPVEEPANVVIYFYYVRAYPRQQGHAQASDFPVIASATLYELDFNTEYDVYVSVRTDYGWSDESDPTTIITAAAPAPEPPTNLQLKALGSTQLEVSWDASVDASIISKYVVTCTDTTGTEKRVETMNESTRSVVVSNLASNTQYTVAAHAQSFAGGISGDSDQLDYTTG